MSEKKKADLLSRLTHDIELVQEYERLLGRQEKLIEDGKLERLARVLDKKAKVLSEIETLYNGAALAAVTAEDRAEPKDRNNVAGLLARFTAIIGELETREITCLRKVLVGRAEVAEQLQAIHQGKKLLRGYNPEPSDGKARFKDIKT